MAPEQLVGKPATERSDVYAYAVTAWEVACGTYPFVATTLGELRHAIDAGRVAEPLHAVSPALVAILQRGLARDPDDRYPSMRALLDDLDALDLTRSA